MKEYRVINSEGLELEVTENELYKIAEHWIDDWNIIEHDYAENNGEIVSDRLWEYPSDLDQVEEILCEYMQCEVIDLDNDEIYRDTEEMYHSLLGSGGIKEMITIIVEYFMFDNTFQVVAYDEEIQDTLKIEQSLNIESAHNTITAFKDVYNSQLKGIEFNVYDSEDELNYDLRQYVEL